MNAPGPARPRAEAARIIAEVLEQGRSLDDLLAELDQLRGVERQWAAERKEIANRIDDLVAKLERLDA